MPVPVIAIATALLPILLPYAKDLLDSGTRDDGTPLTQEEIDGLRALVDQQHGEVQSLPEDGA